MRADFHGLPNLLAFQNMAEDQARTNWLRKTIRPPVIIDPNSELKDHHCPWCEDAHRHWLERRKREEMIAFSQWASDGGFADD